MSEPFADVLNRARASLNQAMTEDRYGLHFDALVELVHMKAAAEDRAPEAVFEEHRALGAPAPDSGHGFWCVAIAPEDEAEWARQVQSWTREVSALRARGIEPR
jgi:hypothetical protein